MSEYCKTRTQYKNEQALLAALMETGNWTREQIEVHDEAQALYGYCGDVRPQRAHIILRGAGERGHGRANVVGAASNDIGFERGADGMFVAQISEHDTRTKYGPEWQKQLRRNYAFHAFAIPQQQMGRVVERERLPDGRQRVLVGGYR